VSRVRIAAWTNLRDGVPTVTMADGVDLVISAFAAAFAHDGPALVEVMTTTDVV